MTGAHVVSFTSAFNDNIYVYDSNGDPTTEVDPDAFDDGEDDGEVVHNCTMQYDVTGISHHGTSIGKVTIMTSAEVAVEEDEYEDKHLAVVGS